MEQGKSGETALVLRSATDTSHVLYRSRAHHYHAAAEWLALLPRIRDIPG
jgi:hypothetical protein